MFVIPEKTKKCFYNPKKHYYRFRMCLSCANKLENPTIIKFHKDHYFQGQKCDNESCSNEIECGVYSLRIKSYLTEK